MKSRRVRTSSLVISELPSPTQENLRKKQTLQVPVAGEQKNSSVIADVDVEVNSVSSKNTFGEEGGVKKALQTDAVAVVADDTKPSDITVGPVDAATTTLKTQPIVNDELEDDPPTKSSSSKSAIAFNTMESERKLQERSATAAKTDTASSQVHRGTRASYYENLNYFNKAFAQSERKRRPTRKAPISPDHKGVVLSESNEKGKIRRPTRLAPQISLKVSPMKDLQQTPTDEEDLTINALQQAPQNHSVSPLKALKQAPMNVDHVKNRVTKKLSSGRGRTMSIILKRDKGSARQVELESSLDKLSKNIMEEAKIEALKFNESVEMFMKNINQQMDSSDAGSTKPHENPLKVAADVGMEPGITTSSIAQEHMEVEDESSAVEEAASAPLPTAKKRTIEFPIIHRIVNDILNSHWTKARSVDDLRRLGYRDKMPYYCHNIDKYWDMIIKVHKLYSCSKEQLLHFSVDTFSQNQMTKGRAIQFARDFDIIPKLLKLKEFGEILDLLVGKSAVLLKKGGIPHTKFTNRIAGVSTNLIYESRTVSPRAKTAFTSVGGEANYSNTSYDMIRRSNNMHSETRSQAFARAFEEDCRKSIDPWTFAKILYACAEVALQKGRYQLIFPFFEDRVDGFFSMVPGIANESLLNAALTKRKFEISHIRYL